MYGKTDYFVAENARLVDQFNTAYYAGLGGRMWMAARLAGCGNILTHAVALMYTVGAKAIPPGQVGLCLSYIASVTGMLGAVIQLWIALGVSSEYIETKFLVADRLAVISVERVQQLSGKDVETEDPYQTPADPKDWPSAGGIQLDNVTMSYRKDLAPVLKGI